MKIRSKVSKFGNNRKIIELPKPVRDNFETGEEVFIEKIKPKKLNSSNEKSDYES